jgi:hypothetical protein
VRWCGGDDECGPEEASEVSAVVVVSAGGGGDGECGPECGGECRPEGASEGSVVVVMSAGRRGRAK